MKYFSLLFFVVSLSVVKAQEVEHSHHDLYSFIENKGQWDDAVFFQSKFHGGNLWVQQHKLVYHLQDFRETHEAHLGGVNLSGRQNKQQVVHVNFVGSNEVKVIQKYNETPYYFNYILGNDPSKWASNVRGYSEAVLQDLYNGIDLKLVENKEQLKYEFHVQPSVDPRIIKMNYAGQDQLFLDANGSLHFTTKAGRVMEEKPYAYQIKNGKILSVPCRFELNGTEVSFSLGAYDPFVTLVIDPTLVFATYSGAITDNFGMTATFGSDGSLFSGGIVYGNNYPMPDQNAYDIHSNFTVAVNPSYGITDVFISKFSPDGTTMLWSTFLGGGGPSFGTETAHSLIADNQDNLYIYGATSSTDFPIVNGYQSTHAGGSTANYYYNGVYYGSQGTDIYVAKLSANGHQLLASTYLGGAGNDGINYTLTSGNYGSYASYDSITNNYGDQFRGEIMLDPSGNCIVASCTRSSDFPTQNAFQPALAGQQDGVVFKLTPDLSNLVWSSYYGGSNNDACYSVKVDSSFNIVVAGGTSSTNLSGTSGGWQSTYNGGKTDGFVFKLTPNGQTLTQATYVGMGELDQAFFVEIDRNDKVFVVGQSIGGHFPVINSPYSNSGSSQFIAKFNENLTDIEMSTVFGSSRPTKDLSPSAFMVDICGNVYFCGWGGNLIKPGNQLLPEDYLSNMPITPNAFQANPPNGFDFYLFVLKNDFTDVLYASYMGGQQAKEHVDGGTSRFDKKGMVYQAMCGGCGGFSDFPTTPGAYSSQNLSTNCNSLVFKYDFNLIPNAEFTANQTIGCAPFTVTFDNFSSQSDSYLWDFGNNNTSSTIFNPTITYTTPGTYTVKLFVTDSTCLLTDSMDIVITVTDALVLNTTPDMQLCTSNPVQLGAYTNGTADQFVWSTQPNFANPIATGDSVITVTPTVPTVYYVKVSNAGCSMIDSIKVDFIGASLDLIANDSICLGQTTTIQAINSNPTIQFTYQWQPSQVISSGQGTNQVVAQPNQTQWVSVTAVANNGCVVEDSILISVGNIPDSLIHASANPSIVPEGGVTTLTVQPSGYSYMWFPVNLVQSSTSQTTTSKVEETTVYTVMISDGVCTKLDTVWVQAFPFVCDDPFVYVPNAFSPNGDGENDVLYVYGAMIQGILFRIYDRWGELVFETRERSQGWDGTFRGKLMDPDVYDYYLQVDCVDGLTNIIKGNVTLMR